MNPALYDGLFFIWKSKIGKVAFERKILSDLIFNFDHTILGFASLSQTRYPKGKSQNVPITNSDGKCQITGTFTVNLLGELLPMHLIYTGTTDFCHPKVRFPSEFYITHSFNHWSNEELVIFLLKKMAILFIRKNKKP